MEKLSNDRAETVDLTAEFSALLGRISRSTADPAARETIPSEEALTAVYADMTAVLDFVERMLSALAPAAALFAQQADNLLAQERGGLPEMTFIESDDLGQEFYQRVGMTTLGDVADNCAELARDIEQPSRTQPAVRS